MRQFAVIGDPIEHSLSPILHGEIFRQLGIDAKYEKFHVSSNSLDSFMSKNTFGISFYDSVVVFERGSIPLKKAPMTGHT